MANETVYDRDFPGHEINPEDYKQEEPAEYRANRSKFAGKTIYDQDFVEHEPIEEPAGQEIVHFRREASPPIQKETNYMSDYPGHVIKVQEPEEVIEIRESRPRKPRFKGKSTYDNDY
jgi:hypothetical protein